MIPTRLLPALALATALAAQPTSHPIPRIVTANGRHALLVDNAPYLILGAQVNNSSAWPSMLPKVWPAIADIHANTVEMPVYWEQFEPSPGHFDTSVVDTLLAQARAHHVHLVLLWFGTWKNGSSHYMPLWMKYDLGRYPLLLDSNHHFLDSPSPFATASLDADIASFSALMRHLKQADPQRTVLMVQVENEPGVWGGVRDYSSEAELIYETPPPAAILSALHKPTSPPPANWHDAFGEDAGEYFQAWAVATYIQRVAAAGKAIYPLPLYVNAALRDPLKPGRPPSYESGGPTDNTIPIWKVTAPAIDLLAPDIYMRDSVRYLKILDYYARPDNPLFIPETGSGAQTARFFFSALDHGAIGFSPFGIDYTGFANAPLGASRLNPDALAPFALNYRLIEPMNREIAHLEFEGKLQAVAEREGNPSERLSFGPWEAIISFGLPQFGPANRPKGNPEPIGRALVAQLAPDQFLVTGYFCRVDFRSTLDGRQRRFLEVEEGSYDNGVFHRTRLWNGDQTDWGLNFTSAPQALRVTLSTY